jgi:uncharacterized protein YndB with AHSA1/START domain
MGKHFSNDDELRVDATPEQVWDAIATGPGIDSWFMGRSEVEPGATVRTAFGGYAPEQRVTAWEPGRRLAYATDPAADGRFVAFEFLVEGRHDGSTVIRAVTSGFLPGDDWEAEYDAMGLGTALFHRTLVEYLTHFTGRTARPVTVFGPAVADWPAAWRSLSVALHRQGDAVSVAIRNETTPGTVYFENRDTLGVRTPRAIYRFLRGFEGRLVAAHHVFAGADTEAEWQAWLEGALA